MRKRMRDSKTTAAAKTEGRPPEESRSSKGNRWGKKGGCAVDKLIYKIK
jgi:hypothetical protein